MDVGRALQQRAVEPADRQLLRADERHAHAGGPRGASLAEVRRVGALAVGRLAREGDVEVKPACLVLRVVVDAVALARSARHRRAALDLRCALVVGELRGVVDGYKDLLAVVVRVQPDAAARRDDRGVDEGEGRARGERRRLCGALKDGAELELRLGRPAVRAARPAPSHHPPVSSTKKTRRS